MYFISVVIHYVLCFKMLSLYLVVKFKLFFSKSDFCLSRNMTEIITLQNKLLVIVIIVCCSLQNLNTR